MFLFIQPRFPKYQIPKDPLGFGLREDQKTETKPSWLFRKYANFEPERLKMPHVRKTDSNSCSGSTYGGTREPTRFRPPPTDCHDRRDHRLERSSEE